MVKIPMHLRKRQPSRDGNKHSVSVKDPKERQKAYTSFCAHVAEGYPIEGWSYRNDPHHCTYQTMLSYITEQFPDEFQTFLKSEAHAKGYLKWFKKGEALTDGKIRGNPSPQTWAIIMRNIGRKYGWDVDKEDVSQAVLAKLKPLDDFFSQIAKHQSKDSKDE